MAMPSSSVQSLLSLCHLSKRWTGGPISRDGFMNRAVTRWEARALVAEYLAQLRKATEDAADEPDPITGETGPRPNTLEQDWRQDAQAAALSPQEIDDSWVWFRRNAFEAPPVLEEAEQRAVEQEPRGVGAGSFAA